MMNPKTIHIGDTMTIQRGVDVGQRRRGMDKMIYSFVETTQLPRQGMVEKIFPRFVLLRMIANQTNQTAAGRQLYCECFFWEEVRKVKTR